MKKYLSRVLSLLMVLSIVLGYGSLTAQTTMAATSGDGKFHIQGSQIIGPDGNNFLIKGVNIQGPRSWEPRSVVQDVHLIADVWKFNFVRLVTYIGNSNGWGNGTGANDDIDGIIKAFTDKHVVVLVDMHDTTGKPPLDETTDPKLSSAETWFKGLAAKYKDNPYVWYGTMNEPLTNTDELKTQWVATNKALIAAIRENGSDNPIVCDGWGYATEGIGGGAKVADSDSATLSKGQEVLASDPTGNTIFALHDYAGINIQSKLEDFFTRVKAKNLCLYLEEFGNNDITDGFKNGVKSALKACINSGIGRVYWNWDGSDLFDMTNGTGRGSGWEIDKTDGTKPTNLNWVGDKLWDDNHGSTLTFDDQNPKTDLSIDRLIVNKNVFAVGDKIKFTGFLLNSGDIPVSKDKKTYVQFYVDNTAIGTPVEVDGAIGTDERVPVTSAEYTVTKTDFTVKAQIDQSSTYVAGAEDAVVENNSKEEVLKGTAPTIDGYDLAVTSISVTPANLKQGDQASAKVTITNLGNKPSPANNIVGWFYANDYYYTGDAGSQAYCAGSLAPGASVYINATSKYRVDGPFSFSYVLENNYAQDLNPTNNQITIAVPVKLSEGVINVVTNPGFEDGLTGWQDWGYPHSTGKAAAHSGSNGIIINGGKAGGTGQNFTLKPNTTYVLGMWGKFNGAIDKDGFDAALQYHLTDPASTYVQNKLHFDSTDWSYKTVVFTTPGSFADTPQLALWKGDTSASDFYCDDIVLSEVKNIVTNSDFEDGLTGWQDWGYPHSVAAIAANSGTSGLIINGGKAGGTGQNFVLKPNTTYMFGMWGKFTGPISNDGFVGVLQYHLADAASTYVQNMLHFDSQDWTYQSVKFTTPATFGDTPQIALWKGDTSAYDFYCDNIVLTEIPADVAGATPVEGPKGPNLIANNGFELGNASWNLDADTYSISDSDKYQGTNSLKMVGTNNWHNATQTVTVAPNTDYTLSAYVKGNAGVWMKLLTSAGGTVAESGVTPSLDSWSNGVIKFNSGDNTSIILDLLSQGSGTTYIDNVYLGSDEGSTVVSISSIDNINASAIKDSSYTLPTTVTAKMSDNTNSEVAVTWDKVADTSRIGSYTFTGTVEGYATKVILTLIVNVNLVANPSFENNSGWYIDHPNYTYTTEEKHTGNSALKVESTGVWGNCVQSFDVNANTDYVLAFYTKGTGTVSIDALTQGWGTIKGISVGATADWTLHTLAFNSGSNKSVVLSIRDEKKDGTYYVDDVTVMPIVVITGVDNLTKVVTQGDSYTLPTAVNVNMSDNTIATASVVWDKVADTSKAGVYTFNGTIEGYNLPVLMTLTVNSKIMKYTVIFKDKTGRTLETETVDSGLTAYPHFNPTLNGYIFNGWDKAYTNVTSDLVINAVYTRATDTYLVTVTNGTLSTGGTSNAYQFDMPVTVVAKAEAVGKKFSHWELDGQKVSANKVYTFYVPMKATTLTAVYVDKNVTLGNTPFITLLDNVMVDNKNRTMVFTATRTVPEGYTLVNSGILLLKSNSEVPTASDLIPTNTAVFNGEIGKDSTDQFYIRKLNISSGDTWYARAYVTYTANNDNSGLKTTVFSDNIVSRTMNGGN